MLLRIVLGGVESALSVWSKGSWIFMPSKILMGRFFRDGATIERLTRSVNLYCKDNKKSLHVNILGLYFFTVGEKSLKPVDRIDAWSK